MSREEFIRHYMATFLASYAAVKYEDNCMRGWPDKNWQPVEDAETLAVDAWDRIQKEGVEIP